LKRKDKEERFNICWSYQGDLLELPGWIECDAEITVEAMIRMIESSKGSTRVANRSAIQTEFEVGDFVDRRIEGFAIVTFMNRRVAGRTGVERRDAIRMEGVSARKFNEGINDRETTESAICHHAVFKQIQI